MPKTELAEAVCEKCGADVREGTTFCYNCGSPLVQPEPEPEEIAVEPEATPVPADDRSKAALDDLAERLRLSEDEDQKLAKAAAERKRARVSQRRSSQYTWESSDDSSGVLLLIVALVIAAFAGITVFMGR